MRWSACLILVIFAAGCASQKPATQTALPRTYDDASAYALSFDPPVAYGQPEVPLDRDIRRPAAFVGYDQDVRTYFDIHTDDDQRFFAPNGDFDCSSYERRSLSDRVGFIVH